MFDIGMDSRRCMSLSGTCAQSQIEGIGGITHSQTVFEPLLAFANDLLKYPIDKTSQHLS